MKRKRAISANKKTEAILRGSDVACNRHLGTPVRMPGISGMDAKKKLERRASGGARLGVAKVGAARCGVYKGQYYRLCRFVRW